MLHAGNDFECADVLETVVHESVAHSTNYDVIHSEVAQGTPSTIATGFGTISNDPPIDHVILHRPTSIPLLIEDKNVRDWFYPDSRASDLASLAGKAIRNGLTPVLITRKVPYVTRLLLQRVGILAFETHHQFFHPDLVSTMAQAKHKDGLGFHDIIFSNDPFSPLIQWLDSLKDRTLTQYQETFRSNESTILSFSVEKSIGYHEFVQELGVPWSDIEEDAYDYGE